MSSVAIGAVSAADRRASRTSSAWRWPRSRALHSRIGTRGNSSSLRYVPTIEERDSGIRRATASMSRASGRPTSGVLERRAIAGPSAAISARISATSRTRSRRRRWVSPAAGSASSRRSVSALPERLTPAVRVIARARSMRIAARDAEIARVGPAAYGSEAGGDRLSARSRRGAVSCRRRPRRPGAAAGRSGGDLPDPAAGEGEQVVPADHDRGDERSFGS